MQKKILARIQKLEQQKKLKLEKLAEKQKEIENLELHLKKLYALKREYEKLGNKSVEYLQDLKIQTKEEKNEK